MPACPQATVPSVSVIVPAGPGCDQLGECLEALAHCRPPANELIVVIDGAGTEAVEAARRFDAEVLVEPRPTGPAAARNRGSRQAQSEILLFVDADVVVKPDVVGRVALMLSGDGGPCAVFGSYDDNPSAPGLISRYRNLHHHWVHQHGNEQASTFWSGCGAVRRTAFEAVEGFPDIPALEDIALGTRLLVAGHRIRLDPTLQVRHLKRWTLATVVWTDLTKRAIPWTEMMMRRRHLINELNVDATGRASVALMAIVVLALLAAIAVPAAGIVAAVAVVALVAVNARFYRFLADRCGRWFAIRSIPLHWLYYVLCGIGFVIGTLRARLFSESGELEARDDAKAA